MLPLHIPDYIANVHNTTPKPDPDHHSELAPPDPSQSALLFLGIVLHLIIPKHDALLRVIVAVHLVEIEPDTIETEDPGPMKNQASAAQLCLPKPVNLSRHSPTPRKPTPHREDRDLQHHVRHWIGLSKDPPLAPLKTDEEAAAPTLVPDQTLRNQQTGSLITRMPTRTQSASSA